MTVVVDIGCHSHPQHQGTPQDSIGRLLERFRPRLLYGFDPHPDTRAGHRRVNGCAVTVLRQAAWVRDGDIEYEVNAARPLSSRIREGDRRVPCFSLASFLQGLDREPGERLVVKMDVQGAEYPLLLHLLEHDAARLVDLLLVEWHPDPVGDATRVVGADETRAAILAGWPGPVEEWSL